MLPDEAHITGAERGGMGLARDGAGVEDVPWQRTVDPYQGCEFACAFCPIRLNETDFVAWRRFARRVGINASAAKQFIAEVSARRWNGLSVVLGARSEPWQQAEERLRLTRSVLEALAKAEKVHLRATTRSSLIARDVDVLRRIASRGSASITFSLACLDDRVNRLMEPHAPSALRRLAAMEALARSGIRVALLVSPVYAGIDEHELGLEPVLNRAANAGAQFAGIAFLQLDPGQRQNLLRHLTAASPQSAARFRRILGRRTSSDETRARVAEEFEGHCRRLGLLPLERMDEPTRAGALPGPSQLSLFASSQTH